MNRKNNKYYAFSIFNFILLHIPIITIYFNSIVKSVTLVSILFLVKSISVVILEVPTGYISDRYSRKLSLILGILFNILSLMIFVYKPNFYSLLIGEICYGVSECLISGSDAAFYYDNFTAEGRKNDYNLFVKNIGLIQSVFLSISFFIGSVLYGVNNKIAFIITILFQLLALSILLTIKEQPYRKNMLKKESVRDEIKTFIKESDNNLFYILVIYSSILAIFSSLYMQLFPIVTSKVTDNYCIYGSIYIIVMMIYGLGAKNGNEDISKLPKVLAILLVTMAIGIVINNDMYILLIIIISRFIWGYVSTGLNIYMNCNIEDSSFRATTFSILSILTSLFSSVFMFLMGWIIDNNIGLKYLFFLWGLILFVLLIIYKKLIASNKLVLEKGDECNDL